MQHQATCIYFIARIYFNDGDIQLQFSRKKIMDAIDKAQQVHDFDLQSQANQILCEIQQKDQCESNNLIMYLSSYPLVEAKSEDDVKAISQQNMCWIELENHLTIKAYLKIGK